MKAKIYDWIIQLTHVDNEGKRTITYVKYFDATTEEIAAIANDYFKSYAVVHVYKLQIVL